MGYLRSVFLKGMAMGAADVVPGVSGGTIAFITGIYQRLLNALKSLHPLLLVVLYREGFSVFWQRIDGHFLLALFSGVLLSIISLATLIDYLMRVYPILVWSFFFGLVCASAYFLIRQIPQWNTAVGMMLVLGVTIAVGLSLLRPAQLPNTQWMMFLAGFIAVSAMILPGISGSFLLLLMGMYSVVIEALSQVDVVSLSSFAVGCFFGLMAFSHVLSFLLNKYTAPVLGLLVGFLVGSLHILWPWKQVVDTVINRHGEIVPLVQQNISPMQYLAIYEQPPQVSAAVMLLFVGFAMVFLLEYSGRQSIQHSK